MTTSVSSIANLRSRDRSVSMVKRASRFFTHLELIWQVQHERRKLSSLDERMLKDIGLDRGQVEAEVHRSFFDLPAHR